VINLTRSKIIHSKEKEMKEMKESTKPSLVRRKLVQSVWMAPIVSSVVLPAHAQTSPDPVTTITGDTLPTSFTEPGTYSFTVGQGVTSIQVEMSGAGGGGGGSRAGNAAAGGDGELVNSAIAVTPGQVLSIVVGLGGTGGLEYNSSNPIPQGGYGGEGGGLSSVDALLASGGGGGGGEGDITPGTGATDGTPGGGPAGGAGGSAGAFAFTLSPGPGQPGGAGGGASGGAGGPAGNDPGNPGVVGGNGYVNLS
jgi:hypothetical protein